ncbi:MAG: YbaK/EbsC family protein [Desulfobacteraceae bacterium]|nr:YbaK/EbsC family protein [Desulfobacteraceae bacterium]
MTLEENIVRMLEENGMVYERFAHEPVYTNPAMAEALGVAEGETVKSLVLATKEGEMIVMVLPGDRKVDWKRSAAAAGTKKVSFAKPEAVLEAVGCEVGCVPPFGHGLAVYMDSELADKAQVYFNPGVHHKSLKISGSDLEAICQPTFV